MTIYLVVAKFNIFRRWTFMAYLRTAMTIAATARTITTATTPQTMAITVIELSGVLSGSFTVRTLTGAA